MVLIFLAIGAILLAVLLIIKSNQMSKEADDKIRRSGIEYEIDRDDYVYMKGDSKSGMTCEDECSCGEGEAEVIDLEGIDKPIPEKKLKEWR